MSIKKNKTPMKWLNRRAAGLLLHPTSLPGAGGVGTLGAEARELLDFMQEAGLAWWQVCPLGPTGFGDSPYQCFSAFAGNPYLIDLEPLVAAGLLARGELAGLAAMPSDHVEFGVLWKEKWSVLKLAFGRFVEGGRKALPGCRDFGAFCAAEASWLEPFTAFMALKGHHGGRPWYEWDVALASYVKARPSPILRKLKAECEFHAFCQWLFFSQWMALKTEANKRGIGIIGDMPIFVSLDSADIWSHPEIFQLDAKGRPKFVAGVPPDYFSETGQLWGNPLYDWSVLAGEGFGWWVERFRQNFGLYDIVRLDHFRGFYDYWQIPANAPDARKGKWIKGPREAFFQAVAKAIPGAKIIAEDLGDNMKKVFKFRDALGLPGMAILQFAYDGKPDNPYLPENVTENSVMYPGTHDNDTTLGWYRQESETTRDAVRRALGVSGDEISYDFIRTAYRSRSGLAIVAMQDFMALGGEARLNRPGTSMGNWQWRYASSELARLRPQTTTYLRQLALEHARDLTAQEWFA